MHCLGLNWFFCHVYFCSFPLHSTTNYYFNFSFFFVTLNADKPQLSIEPNQTFQVQENDDLAINITIRSAFPTEIEHKIRRAGSSNVIFNSGHSSARLEQRFQIQNGTNALLRNARLEDNGEYVLTVSNTEGSSEVRFQVHVHCEFIW